MRRRCHVRMLLLSAFVLLAWTATAHAQCAWVLWVRPVKSSEARAWDPHDAFQTKPACEKAAASFYNDFTRRHPSAVEAFRLPDTVDPRGAKGGAR